MGSSTNNPPSPSISSAPKTVDSDGNSISVGEEREYSKLKSVSDVHLSLAERALAAAGAAVVSAIVVNPLDVAKTRLQAQAAGIAYQNECGPPCSETNSMLSDLRSNHPRNAMHTGGGPACCTECSPYKGTFDVFFKVVRQG